MRALLLLLLRVSTGLLLVIWGSIKAFSPSSAIGVSEKYYGGLLSAEAMQAPLGWLQIALGGLVVLGLFRRFAYPAQAVVLVVGALAIWKYILDPLGLYLLTNETRNVLFFPSLTVAVASLIIVFFKSDDRLSLDEVLFKR